MRCRTGQPRGRGTPRSGNRVTHAFHPSVLRAYDIRGIVGETLGPDDARALGRAFARRVRAARESCRIVVGRDGRLTSPALEAALVEGLCEAGAAVIRVGVGPTPMVHFADHQLAADGSVMVTGSHNPPSHNGFKLSLAGAPFYGEAIRQLAAAALSPPAVTAGTAEDHQVIQTYAAGLADALAGQGRPLRVAWDPGNGAAGAVLPELTERLPGEHRILNGVVDGRFPAHHPDPSKPGNLAQLAEAVRAGGLDLGIAFDGDGDRLGIVDGSGQVVSSDHLLCVFATDVLAAHPGAAILADVKTSDTVFRRIRELGGHPKLGPTGHAHMRSRVLRGEALFAGEMSGHLFFADEHPGYDDALYAAVRLLRALSRGPTLAERRVALPQTFSTPEIRIPYPDDRKFEAVRAVHDAVVRRGIVPSTLDGVRVSAAAGWWLLRASNTEAALVVRCETYGEEELARMCVLVRGLLTEVGIEAARIVAS